MNLVRVVNNQEHIHIIANNHYTAYKEKFGNLCLGGIENYIELVIEDIQFPKRTVWLDLDTNAHVVLDDRYDRRIQMPFMFEVHRMYMPKDLRGKGNMREMLETLAVLLNALIFHNDGVKYYGKVRAV